MSLVQIMVSAGKNRFIVLHMTKKCFLDLDQNNHIFSCLKFRASDVNSRWSLLLNASYVVLVVSLIVVFNSFVNSF